jgi:hypothetical protein
MNYLAPLKQDSGEVLYVKVYRKDGFPTNATIIGDGLYKNRQYGWVVQGTCCAGGANAGQPFWFSNNSTVYEKSYASTDSVKKLYLRSAEKNVYRFMFLNLETMKATLENGTEMFDIVDVGVSSDMLP